MSNFEYCSSRRMTTDCRRIIYEHFVHRILVQLVGNKRVLCGKSVCTVCIVGLNMYFFPVFLQAL
jgi:hypothetical protein